MKITLILFTLLIFLGCQSNNTTDTRNLFIGKTIFIHDFPKTLSLKGAPSPISSLGANAIYAADTFLIFTSTKTDTLYSVYSSISKTHLLNTMPRGRGNNEFMNISFPLFISSDSNGAKLSFLNRDLQNISTLNITKSVGQHQTYMENNVIDVDIEPETKGAYPLHDSLLFYHYFKYDTRNEYYSIYDFKNKVLIEEDSIYKMPLPNVGDMYLWNSSNCFNPHRNKYATAMQFLNQINIYSLDQKKSISLVNGDKISEFHEVLECPMPDKYEYYTDLISTSEYLFGLYINQTRKNWAILENLPVEIHIYDWDGNPKYKLFIQEKISNIAIDEKQNILYGLTQEEEVFTYDLSRMTHP